MNMAISLRVLCRQYILLAPVTNAFQWRTDRDASDKSPIAAYTEQLRNTPTHTPIKIKAFYVNVKTSYDRASCMDAQLRRQQSQFKKLGITLSYQRWPAVMFDNCETMEQCFQERPECFPSSKIGNVSHPALNDEDPSRMMRGVIGNWCAHLHGFDRMKHESRDFDYFLIFEDDVILLDAFADSLHKLLTEAPPLWTLAAFDTWDGTVTDSHPADRLNNTKLPLLSICGRKGRYWGGQAWLLSAQRIGAFTNWYSELPAIPFDWAPKAPSPLHLGMLSYNPRTALQRRFVADKEMMSLPSSCRDQSESDIRESDSEPEGDSEPENGSKPESVNVPVELSQQTVVQSSSATKKPREAIIFGMYGTGTNMLADMIQKNLEVPNHVELCRNYSAYAYCGGVWKHTHPSRLSEFPRKLAHFRPSGNEDFGEAVAVVIVRHPFSLMRSLQAASYDMECWPGDGNLSWVQQPCNYSDPVGEVLINQQGMPRLNQPTCPRQRGDSCWGSFVKAWNSYAEGYMRYLPRLFHDTIILRYEDMLETPRAVLEQIAVRVGVELPGKIHEQREGSKVLDGKRSLGEAESLKKLSAKDYDSNYSEDDLAAICRQLDKPLLYSLGYRGCQVEGDEFVSVAFQK